MSYRSNSTGFTLIELLIIVVLLAIMASFAIPSFKQLTERNELQSAAEELNAMLQYARSEAVSQRRAISIQALKDKDWGKGLSIGVLASGSIAAPLRKHDGFRAATLTAKEKSAVEHLTFTANGTLVPPTERTFAICQNGKTDGGRVLSISQAGPDPTRTFLQGAPVMLLKSRHKPLYQSGFSMIEVLVALLLISIGVLGMIAMQGKTIQYTADSVERNKAAMLGSNLLESMRASPKALYDVKDQMATQSDFFKAKGSAFPTAPSSCTPLPDAIKDRLGCWAEQVKNELPGAGDLLMSDYYICRRLEAGRLRRQGLHAGNPPGLARQARRLRQRRRQQRRHLLCYYTLRVEP